jgi:methylmalonyl-CoA/ethylmalonyl-CoA epimerase
VTRIKRLDHIALVVDDVEAALGFWRDALGIKVERVQEVPEQQATVAFLPVGDSDIELVRPTTEDSGIARFPRAAWACITLLEGRTWMPCSKG